MLGRVGSSCVVPVLFHELVLCHGFVAIHALSVLSFLVRVLLLVSLIIVFLLVKSLFEWIHMSIYAGNFTWLSELPAGATAVLGGGVGGSGGVP